MLLQQVFVLPIRSTCNCLLRIPQLILQTALIRGLISLDTRKFVLHIPVKVLGICELLLEVAFKVFPFLPVSIVVLFPTVKLNFLAGLSARG